MFTFPTATSWRVACGTLDSKGLTKIKLCFGLQIVVSYVFICSFLYLGIYFKNFLSFLLFQYALIMTIVIGVI